MGHPLPRPSSTVLLVNLVIGAAVIGASRVPRLGEMARKGLQSRARLLDLPCCHFGSSINLGLKAQQPALGAAQSLHREFHAGRPRVTPPTMTSRPRGCLVVPRAGRLAPLRSADGGVGYRGHD